ncbi:MAG: hypothetical protein Q8R37_00115 [Nanoarchaeota archaeon]|nr:hypothetical protein [Nanoarchaeota archaeon]
MPFFAITIDREDPQIEEKLKQWKNPLYGYKNTLVTFSFREQPILKPLEVMIYEAEHLFIGELPNRNELFHTFKAGEIKASSIKLYLSNIHKTYEEEIKLFLPYLITLYNSLTSVSSTTEKIINRFRKEDVLQNLTTKKPWSKKITLPPTFCVVTLLLQHYRDGGMKPSIHRDFSFREVLNETTQGTYDYETNTFYFSRPAGEAGGLAVIENTEKGSLSELLEAGSVSMDKTEK